MCALLSKLTRRYCVVPNTEKVHAVLSINPHSRHSIFILLVAKEVILRIKEYSILPCRGQTSDKGYLYEVCRGNVSGQIS